MRLIEDFVGKPFTVLVATDHGGFELKQQLTEHLRANCVDYEDLGPHEHDPADDYPDYASVLAQRIANKYPALGRSVYRLSVLATWISVDLVFSCWTFDCSRGLEAGRQSWGAELAGQSWEAEPGGRAPAGGSQEAEPPPGAEPVGKAELGGRVGRQSWEAELWGRAGRARLGNQYF